MFDEFLFFSLQKPAAKPISVNTKKYANNNDEWDDEPSKPVNNRNQGNRLGAFQTPVDLCVAFIHFDVF